MGRDGEGRESELDGKGQDGIERDGAGGRGTGRDRIERDGTGREGRDR